MKVLKELYIADEESEEYEPFTNDHKSLEGRLLFAVPKSESWHHWNRILYPKLTADRIVRGKTITGSTQSA